MGSTSSIATNAKRHTHIMPFGSQILPEGGVLFRLWAPAARGVDLCLEDSKGGNDANKAHYLAGDRDNSPSHFVAQWNDDLHHACHVLLTGEQTGYYIDYADKPIHHLGRCLTEGFAYQGEQSIYRNLR